MYSMMHFILPLCASDTSDGRKSQNDEQQEKAQRIVYPFTDVYNQGPIFRNTQAGLHQYPRFHVVHPNDHVDDVFDALFHLSDDMSKVRNRKSGDDLEYQEEQHEQEPVQYQRVFTPFGERLVRVKSQSSDQKRESRTQKDSNEHFQRAQEESSNNSESKIKQPQQGKYSDKKHGPLRSLLFYTFRLFLFFIIASIVLSFFYSLYRQRTYTEIDEYGNVISNEGIRGVLNEFIVTLRKLIMFIKRLNPLRREGDWLPHEQGKYQSTGSSNQRRYEGFENVQ